MKLTNLTLLSSSLWLATAVLGLPALAANDLAQDTTPPCLQNCTSMFFDASNVVVELKGADGMTVNTYRIQLPTDERIGNTYKALATADTPALLGFEGANTHQTEITAFTTTTETVVMATTSIYGVDGNLLHVYVSQARQRRPHHSAR